MSRALKLGLAPLAVMMVFGSCAAVCQPAASAQTRTGCDLPGIDEIIEAKTDILGEAAMRQAGGPSYEFFAEAMPPHVTIL